ncbi:MAG: hypothetical protein M0036_23560 [Desulfobacteraceae bacterium]|nr:hypothetical protein [Desulfobacteraceae bacterium]
MAYWIRQRQVLWIIAVMFLYAAPSLAANPDCPAAPVLDYNRLLSFIKETTPEGPLVLLHDCQGQFDQQLNRENIAYLNGNRGLLEQIQTSLAAQSLQWKLAGSSKRLLVVTEKRAEYADLFETYCRTAVTFVLRQTEWSNPYCCITTMREPVRLPDTAADKGITAYIVHDIADEYIEEYLFFTQEKSESKIKIKLSNRVFTGKIGSYSSKMTIGQNSTVEFAREPYTLWQNSAKNPINVLVAPVEETLHIGLRPATESAIRETIAQLQPKSLEEVRQVVDGWMQVEEAMVGGLVAQLMPQLLAHLPAAGLDQELAASLAERDTLEQYRYLRQGIRVVNGLGVKPAVALYTSEPQLFKTLISRPEMAVNSLSR